MTVTTTDSSVTYTGNGSTTEWPFTFQIPDTASLNVELLEISSGKRTTLSAVDYTATGLGNDAGGSVTYPKSGTPLAATHKITIFREVAITQPVSVSNQTRYNADIVEAVWDRLTMMMQDRKDVEDRSLKVQRGDAPLEPLVTSVEKINRANKAIVFDAFGDPSLAALATDWIPEISSTSVTGDGSTTVFALPVASAANVMVYVDGIKQYPSTFVYGSGSITFTEAPPDGSLVEILMVPPVGSTDLYEQDYLTPAALKASTETSRGTGAIWNVDGPLGRHSYEEQADDSTADLKTTDGWPVPLKVLPGADGYYPSLAWGSDQAALEAALATGLPILVGHALTNCTPITTSNANIKGAPGHSIHFAAANAHKFTVTGTDGLIRGLTLRSDGDLGSGVWGTLSFRDGAAQIDAHDLDILTADDVCIEGFLADDVRILSARVGGSGAARPMAGRFNGCARSGFGAGCHARQVHFGWVLIGHGYTAGTETSTRTPEEEAGSFIYGAMVDDFTGVGIDINGTPGRARGCTATNGSGATFAALQIKSSTGANGGSTVGASMIGCVADGCAYGFVAQDAYGWEADVEVRNCDGNGVAMNNADNYDLRAKVQDWGLDIASSPDTFGEAKVAAVAVNPNCGIGKLAVALHRTQNANAASLRQVWLAGSSIDLDDLQATRTDGTVTDVSEGLVIAGANNTVSERVLPRYATTLLNVSGANNRFGYAFGCLATLSATGNIHFPIQPQRGMTVGQVKIAVREGTANANHDIALGTIASASQIVAVRQLANETLLTADFAGTMIGAIEELRARFISTDATTLTIWVQVEGVRLL